MRIPDCAVPNKAIRHLLAVFKANIIIINHPYGPSLASKYRKMVLKYSMKHAQYRGFDQI